MSTAAIIVAAGRGTRLGGPVPKQYQRLGAAPGADMVLTRTLRAALDCAELDAVLVAIHPDAARMYAAAVAPLDDPRLLPRCMAARNAPTPCAWRWRLWRTGRRRWC